jgi:hypothetical protein
MKNRNKIKLEARTNIVLKYIFSTQGYIPEFNKIFLKQGLRKQLDQDRKEMPASFANTEKYYGFFSIL